MRRHNFSGEGELGRAAGWGGKSYKTGIIMSSMNEFNYKQAAPKTLLNKLNLELPISYSEKALISTGVELVFSKNQIISSVMCYQ